MKNAVVSIAAGKNQILIIKKAKELNYYVIGVDIDPNAIGFKECDEILNLSTYESKPIIERLKDLGDKYHISAVLNRSSGKPVITTAEISKSFNIPSVEPSTVKIVLDKSRLLDFCFKNKIPAPKNVSIKSLDELDINSIKFPCVVKPSFSVFGKCGVYKINDKKDIAHAIEDAKKYASPPLVDIEEFIEGYDVTLMSVVRNGKIYPIVLLDELNKIDRNGMIYGASYSIPSMFSGKREEKDILRLAKILVKKLKIDTSIFLMSCRCNYGSKPKVIEVHLDFGGDLVLDHLIPASTDYDLVGLFIRVLAGDVPHALNIEFRPTAVVYGKIGAEDRSFSIVSAKTLKELNEKIMKLTH